tara:strand:- start:261 stop:473 length:213 start_codon:yes stop_codon:yes gene_type:complete
MADFKIGDLVQVFDPFNPIVVGKKTKTLAIVVDNVSRPSKNTIKIFWHGGTKSWIPTHWVRKIEIDNSEE